MPIDVSPPLIPPEGASVATTGHAPDPIGELKPTTNSTHHQALAVCAVAAGVAVAWLAQPLAVGVLLGTLLAFTLQPVHQWIRARMPGRPQTAALFSVLGATVVLVGAIGGLGYLLVGRGVLLTQRLGTELSPGGRGRAALEHVAARLHLSAAEVTGRIREVAVAAAERAASFAAVVASATMSGLLVLFFVMLSMHFVLVHGPRVAISAERVVPLPPAHVRALIDEFRRVGRSVLLGTLLTGMAQGFLAGLGYWICGVPDAAFFGAATAVASLIPAVGTLLVWVPIGIWLLATGHAAAGLGELVWGSFAVVGASDYVIRPRLVGSDHDTPALLTFIALFGGVEVFGLLGLIVGPLLMSLALSVLRMFAREASRWRPDVAGP